MRPITRIVPLEPEAIVVGTIPSAEAEVEE
jgi:hypothetical protein